MLRIAGVCVRRNQFDQFDPFGPSDLDLRVRLVLRDLPFLRILRVVRVV